jgi:hypothetical protein
MVHLPPSSTEHRGEGRRPKAFGTISGKSAKDDD